MQRAKSSLPPTIGGADFLRNSKFCALDFMITSQVPAKNSLSGTFWDTFGTFWDIRRALVAGERNLCPQKHTIRFCDVKESVRSEVCGAWVGPKNNSRPGPI